MTTDEDLDRWSREVRLPRYDQEMRDLEQVVAEHKEAVTTNTIAEQLFESAYETYESAKKECDELREKAESHGVKTPDLDKIEKLEEKDVPEKMKKHLRRYKRLMKYVGKFNTYYTTADWFRFFGEQLDGTIYQYRIIDTYREETLALVGLGLRARSRLGFHWPSMLHERPHM